MGKHLHTFIPDFFNVFFGVHDASLEGLLSIYSDVLACNATKCENIQVILILCNVLVRDSSVSSLITSTFTIKPQYFVLTVGKLHPGECTLRCGGNKEVNSPHPDGRHAGDGKQPPQPISRADSQTHRC